jgi:hypothetical protein
MAELKTLLQLQYEETLRENEMLHAENALKLTQIMGLDIQVIRKMTPVGYTMMFQENVELMTMERFIMLLSALKPVKLLNLSGRESRHEKCYTRRNG